MGCGASSVATTTVTSNVIKDDRFGNPQSQNQAQFQTPGQNGDVMDRNSRLNLTADAILKDDIALVSQCLQFVRPYENVKTDGTFSSCLHEAAYNNAEKAMGAYCQWLKTYEGNQIGVHMMKQDTNRATVAMAAITNNSAEALYVMLCEQVSFPNEQVMNGKDMLTICKQFSHPCHLAVKRFNLRGQPNQDEEWLAYKKSLDPNQEPEQPAQAVVQPAEENTAKEQKWDEEAFKRKMEQRRKEDEEWERQQAIKREELRKKQEEEAIREDEALRKAEREREEAEARGEFVEPVGQAMTKEIYATMCKRPDGEYYITRTEGCMPNWGKPLPYEDPAFVMKGVPEKSEMAKVLDLLADGHVNLFIDAEFLTHIDSLSTDSSHKYYDTFLNCEWKRPDAFFETDFPNIKVFDKISPNDISQGILGVCYMLSSLAAIAEYPKRLEKIFLNTFVNKWGVYGVRYYVRGIPIEVHVDDRFPCKKGTNQPLFSKPKGKELWVMIAEKAWAKVYKSFAACEHGYIDEALEYLTGAPSVMYNLKPEESDDSIWSKLHSADQNKYIVCAGTRADASKDKGMVANHAYSVISAHDADGQRILKLRNPWGKFEWNGDYSDNSSLWTPELKTKLGYESGDDGVFFMSLPDFRKNFGNFAVNMYHDDWQYSYTKSEAQPKHAEYFTIMVDKPCTVYFRLHFKDSRLLEVDRNAYDYPSGDIIIAKVEGKNSDVFRPILDPSAEQHPTSVFGARSVFATKDLKIDIPTAGQHLIRIKIRGAAGQKTPYTLSAYSPVKLKFEKLKVNKRDFIPQVLQFTAQKNTTIKEVAKDGKMVKGNYLHNFYVYLTNENAHKTWDVNIKFEELQNLRIAKKYAKGNEPNTLNFKIPPKSTAFAYLKQDDLAAGTSYKWTFGSAFN